MQIINVFVSISNYLYLIISSDLNNNLQLFIGYRDQQKVDNGYYIFVYFFGLQFVWLRGRPSASQVKQTSNIYLAPPTDINTLKRWIMKVDVNIYITTCHPPWARCPTTKKREELTAANTAQRRHRVNTYTENSIYHSQRNYRWVIFIYKLFVKFLCKSFWSTYIIYYEQQKKSPTILLFSWQSLLQQ